jgi:hypothetical protein
MGAKGENTDRKISKASFVVAVIGIAAAIFSIIRTESFVKLGEERYQEQQAEERRKKEEDSIMYEATKRVTFNKLNVYRKLIHTERKTEFSELYDELGKLMADSSIYCDNDFKVIISNHQTALQIWLDRTDDSILKVPKGQLHKENYDLKNRNQELYNSICSRYKTAIDVTFFSNIYLY